MTNEAQPTKGETVTINDSPQIPPITGTGTAKQPMGVFASGNHTGAANYLLSAHGDPWAIDMTRMRAFLNTLIVSDMPQEEAEKRTGPLKVDFFDCEAKLLVIHPGTPIQNRLEQFLAADNPNGLLEAALKTGKTKRAIAVLPLLGPITQRAGLFTAFFGGTSTEKWGQAFDDLIASPAVGAVVIDGDSPGGSVAGVQELADKIFKARDTKPIVFVANTWLASAAYWIASQGDQIVVSPSGEVGSIGVRSMHVDESSMLEQLGLDVTLISAGKYKTEWNPYEPLGKDAEAYEQEVVNRYYGEFVAAVARGRNTQAKTIRNGFGEGRMVGAKDAVTEGMADRVATLEQTIKRLGGGIAERQQAQAEHEVREEWLAKEEGELGLQDGEVSQ